MSAYSVKPEDGPNHEKMLINDIGFMDKLLDDLLLLNIMKFLPIN